MLISLLIPTVPRRFDNCYVELVKELERQIGNRKDIEIIGLFDNRRRTIGHKRNDLLSMVMGKYFAFLDDDDWIVPTYVAEICNALKNNPDLVLFDLQYIGDSPAILNGSCLCKYGVDYVRHITPGIYYGPPTHTHVWRTELVKDIQFPNVKGTEDVQWCSVAKTRVKHVITIASPPLYIYRDDWSKSETQKDD
jgi:glycosyltransferase involved in cell wall biosynthesis